MKSLMIIMFIMSIFGFAKAEAKLPDISQTEIIEAMYHIDEFVLVETENDVDGFYIVRIRDKSMAKFGYCLITTNKFIVIGGELADSPEEWSVILHEIGHIYDPNGVNPDDHSVQKEMRADAWAVAHGAKPEDLMKVVVKYGENAKFQALRRIINLMGMEAKESPVEIRRVKLD